MFLSFVLISFLNNKLAYSQNLQWFSGVINSRLFGSSDYRISNFNELFSYIGAAAKGLIQRDDFVHLELTIDQEKLLQIYNENKVHNKSYYPATLLVNSQGDQKKLRAKVRGKGDRELHFENLNTLSFRVNLKGEHRLFALDEFSIQKPIIRNYSWEYLISDVFRSEGLLALKSHIIKFSVNGDNRGLFTLEETPSKETIELQKRKNGPIFGLNEDISTHIDTILDPYELKTWEHSEIYVNARKILNTSFQNALGDGSFSDTVFDFDEWAKYFALSDVFGSYHGAVPKSVKFYFNPVIGKFQPILFDAHIGAGSWGNFVLLDFINPNDNLNCEWICIDKNFFQAFLTNEKFLSKYIFYLRQYSDVTFLESIKNRYEEFYKKIDNEHYSRISPSDSIFYRGFLPYFFKFDRLDKRIPMIKKKLMQFDEKGDYLQNNDTPLALSNYITEPNIKIVEHENLSIIGSEFNIDTPTIFIMKGKINLKGITPENKLVIQGPAMFIFESANVILENVTFNHSQYFPIKNRNLSGALNFVDSDIRASNFSILNSAAEDAVNFVNSQISISDILIEKTFSDAVDMDFALGSISNLRCKNIGNDCLDLSESNLNLGEIYAEEVQDKAISLGENSQLEAKLVLISNSAIGIVSKDGSFVSAEDVKMNRVSLPFSSFNKKPSYSNPTLIIGKISSDEKLFGLFSNNAELVIPTEVDRQLKESQEIEDLMYGAVYGKATQR